MKGLVPLMPPLDDGSEDEFNDGCQGGGTVMSVGVVVVLESDPLGTKDAIESSWPPDVVLV